MSAPGQPSAPQESHQLQQSFMQGSSFHLIFVLLIVCLYGCLLSADEHQSTIAATMSSYCIQCHGDSDGEGSVDLSGITSSGLISSGLSDSDLAASAGKTHHTRAELLRKIVHVLEAREMPPEDEEQPEPQELSSMIREAKDLLGKAVRADHQPRKTQIRRMNRFQYNNAVVDLLDLKCNVFTLPERAMRVHRDYFDPANGKMPDKVSVGNRALGKSQLIEPRLAGVSTFPQDLRAEHGYDTQADHLSLSPMLMESFLRLGESITRSPDFVSKNVGLWNELFAAPAEADCQDSIDSEVQRRLQGFLTKAFRRPVEDELLERYVRFVLNRIQAGDSFTDAMKASVSAAIASPRFLYLYGLETLEDKEGQKLADSHLADLELASRLSFFLWGSIPDRELLDLAENGKLSDEATLLAQVDRMLADKKLKRFCDSFPSQWLQLDRIVSSVPDPARFPVFYFLPYRFSMHMMMEPLLLFETVLIEDRAITDLIDPDFTYRSPRLDSVFAKFDEGGANKSAGGGVGVLNFHRKQLSDRRAGGVITNPAVMTMTSGPERTQPITRGAWVAGVIFNDPPEPPPANVPPLNEKPDGKEKDLTLRERLAAHRQRSDCRGCHEQIDPLGFALENYNPIGQWRSTYDNGRDIDASGTLFREHAFGNVGEFKDAILADKKRFSRALAGHLLTFALGRRLVAADELALDEISQAVADDDYRMKTLIRQVILSRPFRAER